MSDYKGAALMIDAFPKAKALLGNKGYDADWLRQAFIDCGISPWLRLAFSRPTSCEACH
jgi:hypothetical protein